MNWFYSREELEQILILKIKKEMNMCISKIERREFGFIFNSAIKYGKRYNIDVIQYPALSVLEESRCA